MDPPTVGLNTPLYVEFVKALYCPPKMDAQSVPFDQVRKMSMQKKRTKNSDQDLQALSYYVMLLCDVIVLVNVFE